MKLMLKYHLARWLVLFMGLLLLALSGCEQEPTEVEDYEPEAVLTAYIETGKPVGEIWIERVWKDIGVFYDPVNTGIGGVQVKLFSISSNARETDTLQFIHDGGGRYIPAINNFIVEPKVRYRIEANKISEGLNIWAETVTPDTFTLSIHNIEDKVIDQESDLELMESSLRKAVGTWEYLDNPKKYEGVMEKIRRRYQD